MKIVEGLNQAGGFDVAVEYVKDVDPSKAGWLRCVGDWRAKSYGEAIMDYPKICGFPLQQPFGCLVGCCF